MHKNCQEEYNVDQDWSIELHSVAFLSRVTSDYAKCYP